MFKESEINWVWICLINLTLLKKVNDHKFIFLCCVIIKLFPLKFPEGNEGYFVINSR